MQNGPDFLFNENLENCSFEPNTIRMTSRRFRIFFFKFVLGLLFYFVNCKNKNKQKFKVSKYVKCLKICKNQISKHINSNKRSSFPERHSARRRVHQRKNTSAGPAAAGHHTRPQLVKLADRSSLFPLRETRETRKQDQNKPKFSPQLELPSSIRLDVDGDDGHRVRQQ